MGKPRKPEVHRIAICTGGGDAPGLNAVIKAASSRATTAAGKCSASGTDSTGS